jgi:hypothetical protein
MNRFPGAMNQFLKSGNISNAAGNQFPKQKNTGIKSKPTAPVPETSAECLGILGKYLGIQGTPQGIPEKLPGI